MKCAASVQNKAHGGNAMFDVLDRQTKLTGNQKKIIAAGLPERLAARLQLGV